MSSTANAVVVPPKAKPKKPPKLTPQRENFARHVVMGFSQAEAYRRSYVVDPETKQSTIWEAASRLANDSKVAARIAELKAEAAERAVVTRESMLAEMEVNRTLALDAGKLSVAQAASRDRAKVAELVGPRPPAPPPAPGDAAGMVEGELTEEARSLNEIARRIAFALALGKRKTIEGEARKIESPKIE